MALRIRFQNGMAQARHGTRELTFIQLISFSEFGK
jgi:hypothetical protein